ncbi:hypothetical protein [Thalassobaculum litoreum]|uniref:Uncharacterized protein n=1 Tax=Thalassobaculum litoreum DSM 18839 TaxID=1123362 RepID=A0A8G2BJD3_9PROT|nr:hypothetical protein [Thalassobaculum litoreum]SDF61744.1 hypothetical protein SAMN05660686_01783 [Thalassobaculum litoreum DSM 18839]
MSDPKSRGSFARLHASNLPGQPTKLERTPSVRGAFDPASDELRAKERAAQSQSEAQRRESFMVRRSKPEPTLKPTRALSLGPDRAAFQERWAQEQRAAAPAATPSREDRKAAFMKARGQPAPDRIRERTKDRSRDR